MLVVRKSRIPNAGRGLFTTSRIRKGDIIIEYLGDRLTWKQCLKRYKNDLSKLLYVFAVSDDNCIDAKTCPDELAQYANDANGGKKDPKFKNNCEYKVIKKRPFILAIKEIPANAEILVDYGDEYWEAVADNAKAAEKEQQKKNAKKEKPAKGKKKAAPGKSSKPKSKTKTSAKKKSGKKK